MSLFEDLLGKHHGHRGHHDRGHGQHGDSHHGDHHREHRDDHHGGHHDRFGSAPAWGNQNSWGAQHSQTGDSHGWGHERRHAGPPSPGALLGQLMQNKTALIGVALLALVLLVVAIAALAFLLPVAGQAAGFVGENGLKGVLDRILPILGMLWNGAGK